MQQERVKTLVIGGGISGLCAALALGDGALVLEAAPEPGGYCRSIRQDGFVWDYAGHFFHFRTEEGRRFFLSLFTPEELVETRRRCQILYRGQRVDAPFQANLSQLPKAELIDCLCELFHRPEKAAYDSFLDYLNGSFGAAVTEKFLRPYNEKLYACPLDTLDAGAMGRFFPAMTLPEIIDSLRRPAKPGYNSRFLYPRAGAGAFIERLCARLPAGTVRCGRRLAALDPAKHLALDSAGTRYRYDALVNTAPLPALLRLLGDAAADALSANRVLALNLGFAEKGPETALHWLYVPGPEANFYRLGFYDNLVQGPRASLYLELAFPAGAAVDVPREREKALRALFELGLIQPENRLLAHSAVWMDPAYVHLRPGTEARVQQTLRALEQQSIYSMGRYGAWRYCSMEDCMLEAFALGERLRA